MTHAHADRTFAPREPLHDPFGPAPADRHAGRAQGGLDGRDLGRALRRRLPLIALVGALGMGLSSLVARSMPEVYRAEAKLVLEGQDARLFEALPQRERIEIDRQAVETELQVIESRELAALLVDRLGLVDDPYFSGAPGAAAPGEAAEMPLLGRLAETGLVERSFLVSLDLLRSDLAARFGARDAPPAATTPEELRETAISRFRTRVEAVRLGQSLAISVVATHTDAAEAARIANEVGRSYIDLGVRRSRERTERAITFLTARAEMLASDVSALEERLVEQSLAYAIEDPGRRQEMRARIEQLSAQAERAEATGTPDDRAVIAAELDRQRIALATFAAAEIAFRKLERELTATRTRHDLVIDRLGNLDLKAEPLNVPARIVSPAEVPLEPYAPRRKLIVAGGTGGALFLAFLVAAVLEGTDTRLRSAGQVREITGLRTLAYVPEMRRLGMWRARPPLHESLLTDPRGAFAEAIRDLLAACEFPRRGRGRAVAVTSPLPADGKTTIALGIAVAAALGGRRTVIVDLDVVRRGATRMLTPGQPADPDGPEAIDLPGVDIRAHPALGGLHALRPTGAGALDPDAVADLLALLRERYEAVVVDTSPVLVQAGTTRVLPLVDATILALRWGRATTAILADTFEEMEAVDEPVMAAISRVDMKRHRRNGYGGSPAYIAYGARAAS